MVPNNRSIIRKTRLGDDSADFEDMRRYTPEERVGMMWQLSLDLYAILGEPVAEPGQSRHVMRVRRREG